MPSAKRSRSAAACALGAFEGTVPRPVVTPPSVPAEPAQPKPKKKKKCKKGSKSKKVKVKKGPKKGKKVSKCVKKKKKSKKKKPAAQLVPDSSNGGVFAGGSGVDEPRASLRMSNALPPGNDVFAAGTRW